MSLKISVVIPCFNMGRFLPECLAAIERQAYPNTEVLVIDGGSKDNTREVVEKYRYMIDVFVSEPDGGQADAVTKGLKLATGDVHHWHAADDIVMPGAFFRVDEKLTADPDTDLVISDGWAFDDKAIYRTGKCRWISYDRTLLHFARFQSDCAYWRSALTANALPLDVTKPLIVDEDFFLRLWRGEKHAWIDKPLGAFRMHGDQVSQKADRSTVSSDRSSSRQKAIAAHGWSETQVDTKRRATRLSHRLFDVLMPRVAAILNAVGRFITFDFQRKKLFRWLVGVWIVPLR